MRLADGRFIGRIKTDGQPMAEAGKGDTMNERYAMTLQSVPGHDVPATTRLRHALKCLLRSFGLRAIELRELAELTEATADAPASTQSASRAKDDDSVELEAQRDMRNARRVKRSVKKTENCLSGADQHKPPP